MSTWSGWVSDFIARASLADTTDTRAFLNAWAKAEGTSCANNPVSASWPLGGSGNCRPLGIRGLHIQSYTSHAQGASGFTQQLYQDNEPNLVRALKGGNIYSLTDAASKGVYDDLIHWGAPTFANQYGNATFAASAAGLKAPQAHKGWADLQHTFNSKMLPALHQSHKTVAAGLQTLGRARKVLR